MFYWHLRLPGVKNSAHLEPHALDNDRVGAPGASGFARTKDGFWLYYSYLKNPDNNSLILVNEEMDHLLKGFFPAKEPFPVSLSSGFTSWAGKEYFYFPQSNVLYSLDGTEARPYIEFDFGERTLPYSKIMNMSREEYVALVGSGCDGRFESDFGVVQAEISYRMVL